MQTPWKHDQKLAAPQVSDMIEELVSEFCITLRVSVSDRCNVRRRLFGRACVSARP